MLRKQFLKEYRPARYQYLLMTGELTAHLNRVDQETREHVETLVKQIEEKQGVTEQLKMQDLMKWGGLINNIKACAEEIVLKESVYMLAERAVGRLLFGNLRIEFWDRI